MLHFTEQSEPKFDIKRHPLIERFGRSLGDKALGLVFEPVFVSDKPNELIDELEEEERANTMTMDELRERPDGDQLADFWNGVVQDFRQDGIDYAEE